jgi:hypothetical protein
MVTHAPEHDDLALEYSIYPAMYVLSCRSVHTRYYTTWHFLVDGSVVDRIYTTAIFIDGEDNWGFGLGNAIQLNFIGSTVFLMCVMGSLWYDMACSTC